MYFDGRMLMQGTVKAIALFRMIEAPLNSIPTWIVNVVEVCGFLFSFFSLLVSWWVLTRRDR